MTLCTKLMTCALAPARVDELGNVEQTFVLRPELSCYQGHFPGEAVTPAVVEVLLAQTVLATALGRPLQVRRVEVGQFSQVIRPGDRVDLRLACQADNVYQASLKVAGRRAARFILTVEPC